MHCHTSMKLVLVCWLRVSNCSFWGPLSKTDQCSTCASLVRSSYYFSDRLFSDFLCPFIVCRVTFLCAPGNVHRVPTIPVRVWSEVKIFSEFFCGNSRATVEISRHSHTHIHTPTHVHPHRGPFEGGSTFPPHFVH